MTALIGQAELADGHRVLEIGCGTGNLTIRAKACSSLGIEVIGSDPDPLALDRAQRKARRLSGIRFERGYAQRLPYADGEFDRVLSSMMLHHLDSDAKTAAAAEVFRVLRPGGRLHLVDMGGDMTAARRPVGAARPAQPARGRQPRRRDPPTAAYGGVRLRRGRHAQAPLRWTTHLLSRRTSRLVSQINQRLLEARETVSCDER